MTSPEQPWTDTSGKQSPSQPGGTADNPNEGGSGEETHGTASAPSTGNQVGGGKGDTSAAPAGKTGTDSAQAGGEGNASGSVTTGNA